MNNEHGIGVILEKKSEGWVLIYDACAHELIQRIAIEHEEEPNKDSENTTS